MGAEASDLAFSNRALADPLRLKPADLAALEQAIERLEGELNQWKICAIAGNAASVDRLASCRRPLWRVVRQGRDSTQASSQVVQALNMLAADDFVSGRWNEMDEVINEGLELCRAMPNAQGEWVLRSHAAMVAAGRGDEANVRTHTEWINRWASRRGVGLALNTVNRARTLAAIGRGDFELAYQLASTVSAPGTIPPYSLPALWVTLDLVEAAMHTGREIQAYAHVQAMNRADFAAISPRLALLFRGSVAVSHSGEDADELFLAALEPADSRRWLFEHARVELAYGGASETEAGSRPARTPLLAARDTFQQLGASPWLNRAEREAAGQGGLEAPRARNRTVLLTAQELEIARLAASGLTNKEIGARLLMSHRTGEQPPLPGVSETGHNYPSGPARCT